MIKFVELEKTKGVLEVLMVLFKKGDTRSTYIIKSITASRETFYKIAKILRKHGLAKKVYIEDQNILLWTLTPKGKEVAAHLVEIEKILVP